MKKNLLHLNRYVIGILFIFSGLIKANDPNGLSYKMQEFFEAWGWTSLHDYSIYLAIIMNSFEIFAGFAIIIRWQYKWVLALLLTLIIFFTFLTGYALFSGKIATCGCFGDCLPLTPLQSFMKDIILFILILINLSLDTQNVYKINFKFALFTNVFTLIGSFWLQLFIFSHLPIIDCLPYKINNDIIEESKTPAGAIPDSVSIYFTYSKNGQEISFEQTQFPADFDESYTFVKRYDKVEKKGNGLKAKITDFILKTATGNDTTQAILTQKDPYLIIFTLYPNLVKNWDAILSQVNALNYPHIFVTADLSAAQKLFPNHTCLQADATNIKTAARANPTIFLMQGSKIIDKHSRYNFQNFKK
ncbi:MAG: DoxX family protein [Alphaproteobacteria bacterium]|nr:DoxX family protein [Alphaproteobacteria bacterium]